MLKAALFALVLIAVVGGGWYWYQLDEGIEVGIQIVGADLGQGDEIPMTVKVRVVSELDDDVQVQSLELELRDKAGGTVLLEQVIPGFIIPANDYHESTHEITLRHANLVEDTIWVKVTAYYNGKVRQESRTIELPI